jgi:hypothetical protein
MDECRTLKAILCALAVFTMGANFARAAEFTPVIEGATVKIYSSSDEVLECYLVLPFSYWYKGQRHHTETHCPDKIIAISEKSEVCYVEDVQIVNPKIEGPVQADCHKPAQE